MTENTTVTSSDLQRRGKSVTQSILAGEHVTLTRHRVPYARVVPDEWYRKACAALLNAEINGDEL